MRKHTKKKGEEKDVFGRKWKEGETEKKKNEWMVCEWRDLREKRE